MKSFPSYCLEVPSFTICDPSLGQVTGSTVFVSIMLRFPQAGHLSNFTLPAWTKVGCHAYSKTAPHFLHFALMEQPELVMDQPL
jgi:hypothetical protein